MSIKTYEAFVKTVQCASLTRAAQEMGTTQSNISHVLQGMEEKWGLTLLVRSRSGVKMTQEGEKLFPYMKRILEMEEELQRQVIQMRKNLLGNIRLGAFTSVAVQWLPDMLANFQEENPLVQFQMFNGDYHDLEMWLKEGQIDLGFTTLPVPEGCSYLPLCADPLLAILPKTHPLAKGSSVPIAALAKEPFITLLQNSTQDIHRALDQANVRLHVRLTTKDDYALIAMVEKGLGVSIVPSLLMGGRKEEVALLPLEPPATRTIVLAMRQEQTLSPAAEKFVQCALAWVKTRYTKMEAALDHELGREANHETEHWIKA